MYPELNHPALWDGFVRWGYQGYLKFDKKPDNTYKKTPGFNSLDASKQTLFNLLRNYIEVYIGKDKHLRIWEQSKAIKGIEDMKNWDLITAAGGALMGAQSDFHKWIKNDTEKKYDISSYFGKRR